MLRIGFPFSLGGGGPNIFMRRLRESLRRRGLAGTSFFPDPFTDINLYANRVRNPWGRPYVFRVDGIYFDRARPAGENAERNRPIFEGIDGAAGVVFQSDFARRLVAAFHGPTQCPHVVIGNGVDVDHFTPEGHDKRRELGLAPDDLVFLTSAKWRAHKRLADTVELFMAFEKRSGRVCHLLVLGRLDRPIGVTHPRIHAAGLISPEDLPSWYRTGDICLFLSWLDNCPSTVIEAMACGLPVVCTSQGGTRELVERAHGGIVAEADDPFGYEPVDLYRPPRPDQGKLLQAVSEAVAGREAIVAGMDRKTLSIGRAAADYVAFMEKSLMATGEGRGDAGS